MQAKLLLPLALCCSMCANQTSSATHLEDSLVQTLLSGYNKDARPPPSNESTEVTLELYLSSIDDVEERLLTMTIAGVVLATWTDRRLTWNASDYGGLNRLVVGATNIWKPDFALMDACGDVFNEAYFADYYGISILPTGNVIWTLQGSHCARCDFNLTYYPYDIQTCQYRYESFNYPTYLMHLRNDATTVNVDSYHENCEFALISTSAIAEEYVPQLDGNYSNVIFSLTIKRRPMYFMLNVILPCIILAVLTCFVFLLPHTSGERVGLAITLLLAFAVFQMLVAGYLPVNSLTSMLLTNFILTATFFNGLALIVTIFVQRTGKKGDQDLPPWLEKIFLLKLGVLFGITSKTSSVGVHDPTSDKSFFTAESTGSSPNNYFMETAAVKDEQLMHLSASVRNVEKVMKNRHERFRLVHKWNAFSKVFDITMFLLFSIAISWLCITSLVLLPKDSA